MNSTLNTSRRARRAFSARTTLAAALVALACGGCAFDQPFAGLGNILGSSAEAKTAAGKSITGEINSTEVHVKLTKFLVKSILPKARINMFLWRQRARKF